MTSPMFLAFGLYGGNSNSKDCGIRWLSLSAIDKPIKENFRHRSINQKTKGKCERVSLTVFIEIFIFKSQRPQRVEDQAQDLDLIRLKQSIMSLRI